MSAYGWLFRRPLNREVLPLDPDRCERSGSLPAQPSARSYTIDGDDVTCAFGAMMLRFLNRQVFR
jgi:hypothetical protein